VVSQLASGRPGFEVARSVPLGSAELGSRLDRPRRGGAGPEVQEGGAGGTEGWVLHCWLWSARPWVAAGREAAGLSPADPPGRPWVIASATRSGCWSCCRRQTPATRTAPTAGRRVRVRGAGRGAGASQDPPRPDPPARRLERTGSYSPPPTPRRTHTCPSLRPAPGSSPTQTRDPAPHSGAGPRRPARFSYQSATTQDPAPCVVPLTWVQPTPQETPDPRPRPPAPPVPAVPRPDVPQTPCPPPPPLSTEQTSLLRLPEQDPSSRSSRFPLSSVASTSSLPHPLAPKPRVVPRSSPWRHRAIAGGLTRGCMPAT
jgi:hypothetical protein